MGGPSKEDSPIKIRQIGDVTSKHLALNPQKWWFNQQTRDLRYLTGDKTDYLTSIGNLKGIPYFQKPNHHLLGCIFYPTFPYYPMNFPGFL